METKVCGRCKIEKSVGEFYTYKNKKLQNRCIKCIKEYNKTPEMKEKSKQYRSQPEVRERLRTYQAEHHRLNRKFENYRLTLEQFEQKLKEQGGVCAICKSDKPGGKFGKTFFVDHDHKCCDSYKSCGECVRGLLCEKCNRGLGAFKDSPDFLQEAILYLKKYGR